MAIPQQLFFSGVVRGESAMQSERDVGSKVKYEVTVSGLVRSLPSWHRGEAETCPKGCGFSPIWRLVRGLPQFLGLGCVQVFVLRAQLTISCSFLTGHLTCWSGEAMRAQGPLLVDGDGGRADVSP